MDIAYEIQARQEITIYTFDYIPSPANVLNVAIKVQNPPTKPLLLWDGDCGFCGRCARWMQRQTGDSVAYQQYQTALPNFPELDEKALERAVHLVEPNGRITHSAEAIYRTMECLPHWSWLICAYLRIGLFAALSEWGYRRVANNRSFISWLTRSRPKD